MPHVVAVCGSLRDASVTRIACEHAVEGAAAAGGTAEVLDLREYEVPPLDPDRDDQGDAAAVTSRLREADSVVLGTPMYHGSYSGVLKNTLDHAGFDEFEGKTVGLLGVSGGSFPVSALEHLRGVCRALNAWVIPHQAAVPNSGSAVEGGELASESTRDRVETLGRRAVEFANIQPDPTTFEGDQNEGA